MKDLYFLTGIAIGSFVGACMATRCKAVQDCIVIAEKKAKEVHKDAMEKAKEAGSDIKEVVTKAKAAKGGKKPTKQPEQKNA